MCMEKTAIIWNTWDELRYAIVNEDWRRFQGVYVNTVADDEGQQLQDDLNSAVFKEGGEYDIDFVSIDVFADAIRHGAYVVECGFLP